MVEDRIEQEVSIDAPLSRVWELVTEPGWWVPTDTADPPDRTPGSRTVRHTDKWGRFVVDVVQIEPQTYAAFRWAPQEESEEFAAGKATLVEFYIQPVGDAVSVTVVETGFARLDVHEEGRAAAFREHTEGWQEQLDALRVRAEGVPAA